MSMTQEEIDEMLNMGGSDTATDSQNNLGLPEIDPDIVQMKETESGSDSIYSALDPKLELLYDLQLPVSIELGRTNMLIRDILRLGRGSVIEFDKLVSEPVDLFVNGKKIAEGEVVVIDKHFGVRLTTLIDPTDRIKTVKK